MPPTEVKREHAPVRVLVHLGEGVPHAPVKRPERRRLVVVLDRVLWHVEEFVRLSEAVPCPVVARVAVWVDTNASGRRQVSAGEWKEAQTRGRGGRTDCSPVGFDRSMTVLHLDVFVAHERPCWQVVAVELQRSTEVLDRLGMLSA